MLQQKHKYYDYRNSTSLYILLWSFFVLSLFCLSCNRQREVDENHVLENEIVGMRKSQMHADNLSFYVHKHKAEEIIGNGIDVDSKIPDDFLKQICEYNLVYVDYLIQTGHRAMACEVMDSVLRKSSRFFSNDTLLWLDYLCHYGNVNYRPYQIKENRERILYGYDCLVQCYILSTRWNYSKYRGVSMRLISKYLLNDSIHSIIKETDPSSLRYINEEGVPDNLLAGNIAERALCEFLYLNEPYQTAESWQTLALCFFSIDNPEKSVECLHNALANPSIDSFPALKANICQQMSMSYASLNNMVQSDYYRNIFLDIQDSIRQDRQIEARIVELKASTKHIWYSVIVAGVILFLLGVLVFVLFLLRRKRLGMILNSEESAELEEEYQMLNLQYTDAIRASINQRARISFVTDMLPLIERLNNATKKKQWEYSYELINKIIERNDKLTQWVKLQQGKVSPKISIFNLNTLFELLRQRKENLKKKNIDLEVPDTEVSVKADPILTMFILNTLVDNAEKAIDSENGKILVGCHVNADDKYVEITIEDNGKGMTQSQVEHLFDHKPINEVAQLNTKSHGFGLQNCRDIIEKYKKMSSLYSICTIWAKSTIKKGTTIGFRLPLVLKMIICMVVLSLNIHAGLTPARQTDRIADSLYKYNSLKEYDKSQVFADSCIVLLNEGECKDSTVLLSIYNEIAISALATHNWNRYVLYNYRYITLYQEYTRDNSLPSFVEQLEKNKNIANIAMLLSVLLILSFIPVLWFVYLRHIVKGKRDLRQRLAEQREKINILRHKYEYVHLYNNITDNQLSTIKHETMYFPSRINQMLSKDENTEDINDVVSYYRDLYFLLLQQINTKNTSTTLYPVKQQEIRKFVNVNDDTSTTVVNGELISFLFVKLRKHNGGKSPVYTIHSMTTSHKQYYVVSAALPNFDKPLSSVSTLFSTDTSDMDFLVMRQILRETAESSQHYECGIGAEIIEGVVNIKMTLPQI